MKEFIEYLTAIAICSPLFFFIIAVAFRLLDNSAAIFLKHDILVDTSYVSADIIREHINSGDVKLRKSLKRALIFRKLHNLFMILMVISIPPVIIACFFVFK
ncbi:hypothetical protein D1816_13685 [Aquimarina sp. AD10]|uniref:Uncharacterized protein n=1 Tax=Aquimarina aggregata TaxID=1642818 RepID=A0A162YYV8_9FLAO|nr:MULTISPECIES: hypothetical protein [Aquimarina]AXT61352.1 hypothetical protein D1816_13685 [Aquimarina sp. AD10]KZS39445.1 hypothetical protein AWE51_12990 [Aquimarina aggregata]RKN01454.1 hypothetical protein D7033_04290 [Aquimarina sp. AD10]